MTSNGTVSLVRKRSSERITFLAGILCTAVEHQGYGFIEALEYEYEPEAATYALIRDRYEEENGDMGAYAASEQRIDLDTIARGIGIIRRAVLKEVQARRGHVSLDKGIPNTAPTFEMVLHNARTGQRLYLSEDNRKRILAAERDRDAGELDVVDALAVVECAVFGAVVYG